MRKLGEILNEGVSIKKDPNNPNNWPDVKTLGEGSFEGILWGHCFLYENQKYYSNMGWRNCFPSYCKMVIENDESFPYQVDEYQRPKLKELFD